MVHKSAENVRDLPRHAKTPRGSPRKKGYLRHYTGSFSNLYLPERTPRVFFSTLRWAIKLAASKDYATEEESRGRSQDIINHAGGLQVRAGGFDLKGH